MSCFLIQRKTIPAKEAGVQAKLPPNSFYKLPESLGEKDLILKAKDSLVTNI
jgi:hypothetical protein